MNRTVISLIESEFRNYKRLGEAAIAQVEADELVRSEEGASSIATIVWHIAGNLESRYTDFLTSDGEKPWRDRESEFVHREASPEEVQAKWERGWDILLSSTGNLSDDDLARTVTIRHKPLRVDEALFRSLAHTSYHVGQIVYVAKRLRGKAWRYLSTPPGGSAADTAPSGELA